MGSRGSSSTRGREPGGAGASVNLAQTRLEEPFARDRQYSSPDAAVDAYISQQPILDRSDGSRSIFDLKHEEGIVISPDGKVLAHVRGDKSSVSLGDAGGTLGATTVHSHPLLEGVGPAFSGADLALAIRYGQRSIVTTTNGKGQKVKLIADARNMNLNNSEFKRKFAAEYHVSEDRITEDGIYTLMNRRFNSRVGVKIKARSRAKENWWLETDKENRRLARLFGYKYKVEVVR
jgi:hypothetical protein